MKPTNDERREVAARLREPYPRFTNLVDAFGLTAPVPIHELRYHLADLIEPEERTCRNIAGEDDREWGNPFICSECGADPHDAESYYCGFSSGEHDWRFCPNCGAKVMEE